LVNNEVLVNPIKANEPLMLGHVGGVYRDNEQLRALIMQRGL